MPWHTKQEAPYTQWDIMFAAKLTGSSFPSFVSNRFKLGNKMLAAAKPPDAH